MSFKGDKQQNIQMQLDFSDALAGEAREADTGKRLNRPRRQVEPNAPLEPID